MTIRLSVAWPPLLICWVALGCACQWVGDNDPFTLRSQFPSQGIQGKLAVVPMDVSLFTETDFELFHAGCKFPNSVCLFVIDYASK
jgi:hypothetical protein